MISTAKKIPATSQVRIIGGKWRSRKIEFPLTTSLRPTPDRVRETLFNWLMPILSGAHCLDLYAGSGALSFEALSRGAHSAVMLDKDPLTLSYLQKNSERLAATSAVHLIQATLPEDSEQLSKKLRTIVDTTKQPIDIIFLDPPFDSASTQLEFCCHWLSKQPWLNPATTIYIESPSALITLPIPFHWKLVRQKKAGHVIYSLFKTSTA
jgi:16S rRNA (guanine966-N2)-methyltransferase